MERGLLSDQKLAEFHDEVVWMYLYQDFSDSPADRKAQRVAIRFGINSWPQHFLVDPYALEVIGNTGRSLASFSNAAERAKISKRSGDSLTDKALREADARAADLERNLTADTAKAALKDEDSVVRLRALQYLQDWQPEAITAAATELLTVANDHVRFLVCEVLRKSGSTRGSPGFVGPRSSGQQKPERPAHSSRAGTGDVWRKGSHRGDSSVCRFGRVVQWADRRIGRHSCDNRRPFECKPRRRAKDPVSSLPGPA